PHLRISFPTAAESAGGQPFDHGQQIGVDRVAENAEVGGVDPEPAEGLLPLPWRELGRCQGGRGRIDAAEEEPLVGDEMTPTPVGVACDDGRLVVDVGGRKSRLLVPFAPNRLMRALTRLHTAAGRLPELVT